MSNEHTGDQALPRARTLLRMHSEGTLLCDATPTQARYVIDPSAGSLVMCITTDMLGADDCVLAIPEDRFDSPIRVTLSIQEIPESIATDRYIAYHQRQDRPMWAEAKILFAKVDSGGVADGDALMSPNPLCDAIGRLCKQLNADENALREVSRLLAKVTIEHPVAVGVDDEGFDVRAEFGVVRVPWPGPVHDEDECARVIESLIEGVR
jgi:hypothetical protein